MSESLKDLIEETTAYSLPDISKTNALESKDWGLLEATNKQIDENIKASKEEATLYAASLDDVYKAQKERHKLLMGLIPKGYALYKWFQDEKKYSALFDEREKLRAEIEDREANDPFRTGAYEKYLKDHDWSWDIRFDDGEHFGFVWDDEAEYQSLLKDQKVIQESLSYEIDAFENGKLSDLSPEALFTLTSKTPVGAEIDNKATFFYGTQEELPGMVQIAITKPFASEHIYYIDSNGDKVEMPQDMSYIEALTSDNASDNFWAPYIEKAIWSTYAAQLNKKDNLEGLSQRELKNKVFKPFMEEVQKQRKAAVLTALDGRIKKRKIENALELRDQIGQDDPTLGGINAVLSYVSNLEAGGYTNADAWGKFFDQISFLADEEEITSEDIYNLLDTPFPQRGTNKLTTLGPSKYSKTGLKPDLARRLNITASDLKAKENQVKARAIQNDIDTEFGRVTTLIAENEDGAYSDDAAIKTLLEQSVTKLMNDHDLGPGSPELTKFSNLLTRVGLADAYSAHDELTKLQAAGMPLKADLIDRIPEGSDLHGGGNTKAYWQKQAGVLGEVGLNSDEVQAIDKDIETAVRKRFNILDPGTNLTRDQRILKDNAISVFKAKWDQLAHQYRDILRTGDKATITALEKSMHDAAELAALEAVNDKKMTLPNIAELPKENKGYGSTITAWEKEQNKAEKTFQKLKGDKEVILAHPEYWSPIEEQALIDYQKYVASGGTQGKRWSSYYYFITSDGRKFKNTPIDEVMAARLEATKHLRNETIIAEDISLNSLSQAEKADLCTFPSAAKTAQKMCTSEDTAAWMLQALVHPGADQGINTIRRPNQVKTTIELPNGKTLQENTLQEILMWSQEGDNDEVELGIYGLTMDALNDLIPRLGLTADTVFDEDTQQKLMLARIIQRANKDGEFGTYSQQYRRVNYLNNDLKKQFYAIVDVDNRSEASKKFFMSPYNQIETLQTEAAKALADMSLELN